MQNGKFPFFTRHLNVVCFNCDAPIGSNNPLTLELYMPIYYGFPHGAYGMWCEVCKLYTYYDTNDESISFGANRDQWDTSDGWPDAQNLRV